MKQAGYPVPPKGQFELSARTAEILHEVQVLKHSQRCTPACLRPRITVLGELSSV